MNIAICDDIAGQRALIAGYIYTAFPDTVLSEYEDGYRLVEDHVRCRFHLILLDVLMPTVNGIETAELIRKFDDQTPIVFVTTTEEFAVQSYRVRAFDYILKPVNTQSIWQCLSRIFAQRRDQRFFMLDYLGVHTHIRLDNIMFLESELRKVHFHLVGGKSFSTTAKLDQYSKILENHEFCCCHKSFIVNLNHVSSISGEDFFLTDGRQVKISRAYLNNAKKSYFDYVFGKIENKA